MTTFYGAPCVGVDDGSVPLVLGDAALRGGKVHALVSWIDLGANAVLIADVIDWGGLPKGAVPLVGWFDTNRSLGSSTIDLGLKLGTAALTAAYFKAAATFTATDTPTLFMKAAAMGVTLTAAGRVQSTIAAANMPNNSGDRLNLILLYTTPHSG